MAEAQRPGIQGTEWFQKGAHALSFNRSEVLQTVLGRKALPELWGPTQKRKVTIRSFSGFCGRHRRGVREVDDLYRKGEFIGSY